MSAPELIARSGLLESIDVRIADLPGSYLGLAYNDAILIDVDAAGHGWNLDDDGDWSDEMDLLTVLAHEFGHVLGLEDLDAALDPHDIMADELAAGVRKGVSQVDEVDAVFAAGDWE